MEKTGGIKSWVTIVLATFVITGFEKLVEF